MPSSSNTTDDPYYDEVECEKILGRLRQRARHITSRSRTEGEHNLANLAAGRKAALADFLHEVDYPVVDMEVPPAELVRAMRAPAGIQQLVTTQYRGRQIRAVINPLGMRRPDREVAVWKCLVGLVEGYAA